MNMRFGPKRALILVLAGLCLAQGCSYWTVKKARLEEKKQYAAAAALVKEGRFQEAVVKLREYIYQNENVKRRELEAYRLLGASYERLNQLDQALEVYQEALEFHPKDVSLMLLAASLYQRSSLYKQALILYQRALAQDPKDDTALAGIASNYLSMGFYSKAQEYYEQYFKEDDTLVSPYRAPYSYSFFKQRDYAAALMNAQIALMYSDKNPDLWFLIARIYHALGRRQDALDSINAAIAIAPKRGEFLLTKALWLYRGKEYNASLEVTETLLKQNPQDDQAFFVRYLNLKAQGKMPAARKELQKIKKEDSFTGRLAVKILANTK